MIKLKSVWKFLVLSTTLWVIPPIVLIVFSLNFNISAINSVIIYLSFIPFLCILNYLLFNFFIVHDFNELSKIKDSHKKELKALKKDFVKKLGKMATKHISNARLTALGNMAGSIAHEINNPLTIIKSRAEILLIKAQDHQNLLLSDSKNIEGLKSILSTVDRISTIVKGLYVFSKNEDQDEVKNVSLDNVFSNIEQLFSFKNKYSKISFSFPKNTSLIITAKESQILQMISNLILNSCESIENSDNPWIKIEVTQDKTDTCILVTDSGNGISQDFVNNIMEPFFTTKKIGEGTGLGLSISKGIAEDHGGSITYNPDSANTQFIIKIKNSQILPQNQAS